MTDTFGKVIGLGVIVIIVLACLGPCLSTGPPDINPRVVQHQLELVHSTLDALHEEVAAARSPSVWPFVIFIGSVLAPLGAGIWLLWRCERSTVGHDQVIRTLVRSGLGESVVHGYVGDVHRRSILTAPDDRPLLPARPVTSHLRRRHRRRWCRKHPDAEPP